MLHGDDAQVDPQLDVLPVLVRRQDEGVILTELKRRGVRRHLLLQERVVVLLAEDDLLLGQSNVLEDLVKVERPLAEVVVRLEEVEVPRLHHEEKGVLARRLDIEQDAIVERGLAIRAPEVRVSVLLVVIVDIGANKDVRDALKVLTRHIHRVHHGQANLVLLDRLWGDVPDLLLLALLVGGFDLEPAGDDTLRQAGALVVDLSLLDWLLLDRLPITVEETIVKVDRRLTDQVVAEEIVVVVSLDLDHGRTWELTGKLEQLVELGVGLVELVVVALGELAVTAPDEEVRVGEGPNVAACEVKTLKHIELNLAGGLAEELLLDDLIVAGILEEFKQLWLVDIHRVQQCAELLKFLCACNVLNRLELKVLLEHLLVDLADEVEDAVHMALFLLVKNLGLLLVDDLDAPLEVAHDFLVADLTGLVQLVRDDE